MCEEGESIFAENLHIHFVVLPEEASSDTAACFVYGHRVRNDGKRDFPQLATDPAINQSEIIQLRYRDRHRFHI